MAGRQRRGHEKNKIGALFSTRPAARQWCYSLQLKDNQVRRRAFTLNVCILIFRGLTGIHKGITGMQRMLRPEQKGEVRPCHPSIICVRTIERAEKLTERGRPEVFHRKKTRKSWNKTIKLCKIKLAKELKECSFCLLLWIPLVILMK